MLFYVHEGDSHVVPKDKRVKLEMHGFFKFPHELQNTGYFPRPQTQSSDDHLHKMLSEISSFLKIPALWLSLEAARTPGCRSNKPSTCP